MLNYVIDYLNSTVKLILINIYIHSKEKIMAVSEKQKELDLIKWGKSQYLGIDACGSFNYCVHCNKNIENPCENALNRLNNPEIIVEEKPAKKTACKKTS